MRLKIDRESKPLLYPIVNLSNFKKEIIHSGTLTRYSSRFFDQVGHETMYAFSTLVGNSNDPPQKNSESLYCIFFIYCCILGNTKRPIDLS